MNDEPVVRIIHAAQGKRPHGTAQSFFAPPASIQAVVFKHSRGGTFNFHQIQSLAGDIRKDLPDPRPVNRVDIFQAKSLSWKKFVKPKEIGWVFPPNLQNRGNVIPYVCSMGARIVIFSFPSL
jgi:hypothetical protein